MEGIELMSFRAFWFIVAGFVLGFTVSTLWEWLYYRHKRQETLQRGRTSAHLFDETQGSGTRRPIAPLDEPFEEPRRKSPSYRSPGVFLDSETEPSPRKVSASATDDRVRPTRHTQPPIPPADDERVAHSEDVPTITVAELAAQHKSTDTEEGAPSAAMATPSTADATSEASGAQSPRRDDTALPKEEESLGNPAAIARAGALAAASLSSGGTTRTAVTATPPPQKPHVENETQEHPGGQERAIKPTADQEPSSPSMPAMREESTADGKEVAGTSANTMHDDSREENGRTDASGDAEQPTRTVSTYGFAAASSSAALTEQTMSTAENAPEGEASAVNAAATPQVEAASPPSKELAPHVSRNRPHDYPDDLAMIKGIGEAYKRRLYATGIYTWRQLAEADTDSLRRITRAKPNADIASWLTQALALAEKYDRLDANFTGPLDDFTRIDGIGAITADILYKAGICTYEQLAGALPDELTRIVPAPTVGNENDFDGWINDAARLATTKRRNNGMLP